MVGSHSLVHSNTALSEKCLWGRPLQYFSTASPRYEHAWSCAVQLFTCSVVCLFAHPLSPSDMPLPRLSSAAQCFVWTWAPVAKDQRVCESYCFSWACAWTDEEMKFTVKVAQLQSCYKRGKWIDILHFISVFAWCAKVGLKSKCEVMSQWSEASLSVSSVWAQLVHTLTRV